MKGFFKGRVYGFNINPKFRYIVHKDIHRQLSWWTYFPNRLVKLKAFSPQRSHIVIICLPLPHVNILFAIKKLLCMEERTVVPPYVPFLSFSVLFFNFFLKNIIYMIFKKVICYGIDTWQIFYWVIQIKVLW